MPPFLEDMDDMMDDAPMTNIGTDLFDTFGNFDDDEEPLDSGPVIPDIMKEEVAQTVVRIENEDDNDNDDSSEDANEDADEDADEDLENGLAAESVAPEALMDVPAPVSAKKPASAKKGGRPAKGASRVSTPAKTPSKAKKATGGRKRKVEEDAEEPAAKRPRQGRATAAAAKEGIKEASKKRPRAAPGTVKEAPKSGRGRPGRKPKAEKEESSAEEYEIEDILDSGMDSATKQVLFLVKWKGYGDEANTWEPKTNLTHAKELLNEYDAAKKKEEKAARKEVSAKKPAPAKKAPAKAPAKTPAKKTAGKAASGRPGRPGRPARRGRPKSK